MWVSWRLVGSFAGTYNTRAASGQTLYVWIVMFLLVASTSLALSRGRGLVRPQTDVGRSAIGSKGLAVSCR